MLEKVINAINFDKKTFKNSKELFEAYYTSFDKTSVVIPSVNRLYKFSINDLVAVNLSKTKRNELGFKFSLNIGQT